MSAKVSCTVLRGGERGDSRTSPDRLPKPDSVIGSYEYAKTQILESSARRITYSVPCERLGWEEKINGSYSKLAIAQRKLSGIVINFLDFGVYTAISNSV